MATRSGKYKIPKIGNEDEAHVAAWNGKRNLSKSGGGWESCLAPNSKNKQGTAPRRISNTLRMSASMDVLGEWRATREVPTNFHLMQVVVTRQRGRTGQEVGTPLTELPLSLISQRIISGIAHSAVTVTL